MPYACASASWDVGGLGELGEYHLYDDADVTLMILSMFTVAKAML